MQEKGGGREEHQLQTVISLAKFMKKLPFCLISMLLLSGCSSKNALLEQKDIPNTADALITETEAPIVEKNGVPVSYLSEQEPIFPQGSLTMPALHALSLSGETFSSIFLSGSNAIVVGTGNDNTTDKLSQYLDMLSVDQCVVILLDMDRTEAGGLTALLGKLESRVNTVVTPLVSTDNFTESIFDGIYNSGYFLSTPSAGKQYFCMGFGIEFFYPYSEEPTSASEGFAVRITADNTKILLLSGTDTSTLTNWVSESGITADIVVNFTCSYAEDTMYQSIGGRYAYAPYVDTDSYLRMRNAHASQFLDSGYSLFCPDTDGTCVFLLGEPTISVRTQVQDQMPNSIFATETAVASEIDPNTTVFFDGEWYHSSAACSYISSNSIHEITLENAVSSGYEACPYCGQQ